MLEVKADGFDAAFEAAVSEDALAALKAEVAGLRARVEAGAVRAARLPLDGVKTADAGAAADPARAAFVERYLRRGLEAGVEMKSVTGVTNAEGGFAIPREIDAMIDATLNAVSPIRAIANVVTTGSAGYRKLIAVGGTPSGWVSEAAARPMTGTPTFNEIAPPSGHLYANPAASQAMLDDAQFDVEGWLTQLANTYTMVEQHVVHAGGQDARPQESEITFF